MPVYIDGYEIDVTSEESHNFDSVITSDPVEEGSDTTDNIKPVPDFVTLTGIVSDTPFGQLAERRTEGELNSAFALDLLLSIRAAGEPVTVETPLKTYFNMALERLSIPQNVRTGDSLQFSATFKQVRIVSTERTTITVEQPRAKRKVKRGNRKVEDAEPTSATTDKVKEQKDSWLGQLIR